MFPHKEAFPSNGDPSHLAQSAVPIISENQWLSQSAYQNVDASTVDWAAIAQQWIHMKESFGSVSNDEKFPVAPPPPRITQRNTDYEEQGEAPMEVEHDDEQLITSQNNLASLTAPPPPTNVFQTNNWSNNSEPNRPSKSHEKPWNNKKGNRWGSMNHQSKGHRNDSYSSGQVFNRKQVNNAWPTNDTSAVRTNAFSFGNNSNNSKSQATDTNNKSGIQVDQVGLNATPSLNAAQRKTLPAWIREGLEKMEREKLKQAERDREMKERDEKRRQEKLLEQNLLMQFNTNNSSPMLPVKSKFESDSDSDNDETVNSDHTENVSKNAKTTSFVSPTVGSNASGTSFEATATTIKPHRSKADVLTEIMLSVRKNLTEILLEVTNEEIHAIAQETISKMRTKGRKAQTVQKNALTAITPALGLVTYDDSDASKSEDESDDNYESGRQQNSDNDSEIELKRTIHRRKQSFESKSTEIEKYLAKNEEREKQWLEQDNETDKNDESNSSSVPTPNAQSNIFDGSSSTHQKDVAKSQNSGASKSERKGSRFSDAKGLLYNVASSQIPLNVPTMSEYIRPTSVEQKPAGTELKRYESKHDRSESDSDSSRKKSLKSSRHRSKRHSSRSPSSRKHKHSTGRRSSSSSSSSYSRQSKSSQSSHKRDKYSRESSYSRSYSHKSSRRTRSRSRSRSRSRDKHTSRRRR